MATELLIDAVTGAAFIGVVLIYLILLVGTLVCAFRGDIPKAVLCGMTLLTMLFPVLGFLVLIVGLIATLFTRNVERAWPIVLGFVFAIVINVVICIVVGVGVVIGGVV